jgi:biopolymer transport protein ExbD
MNLQGRSTAMDPAKLRLPLIALIDVILFLLIYFLYAGSLAAEEAQLASSLRSRNAEGGGAFDLEPQILTVDVVDGKAVFRIGDLQFSDRLSLTETLRKISIEAGITLRVSDRASVEAAAAASQACHDAGFRKISYLPWKPV